MAASLTAATGLSRIPSLSFPKVPNKSQNSPSFVSVNDHSRRRRWTIVRAASTSSGSLGLYSAQEFELTPKNVDTVLEDVRPYLIADGGNVDVVSVEDGVVSLKLQGACGSCPSSTTTMKMGIERVLKEKFGDAVKDIRQLNDEQMSETTAEVSSLLNISEGKKTGKAMLNYLNFLNAITSSEQSP